LGLRFVMREFENNTSVKRAEKTRLTWQESAVFEKAETVGITGYTYTIPATFLARCYACQAVVAEVIRARGGYPVDVDVEIDQGQPRAILTSPHHCIVRNGAGQ
jgi:hypothetical protein